MFCPQCGNECGPGDNFCMNCGTELQGSESQNANAPRGEVGTSSTDANPDPEHTTEEPRVPRSPETSTGLAVSAGTYTAKNGGALKVSYQVEDAQGRTILTADPDWDGLGDALGKLDLTVSAPNDETLCYIQGQHIINITGGEYAVVDPETGDHLVVLEQEKSLAQPTWAVRDGQTGDLLFRAQNKSKASGFTRNSNLLRSAIPAEYTIVDSDGREVGTTASGKMSRAYDVDISENAPAKDIALLLPLFIHALEVDQ